MSQKAQYPATAFFFFLLFFISHIFRPIHIFLADFFQIAAILCTYIRVRIFDLRRFFQPTWYLYIYKRLVIIRGWSSGASHFISFMRFFDTSHHAGTIIYETCQPNDMTTTASELRVQFLVYSNRVYSSTLSNPVEGRMTVSAEKKVQKDKSSFSLVYFPKFSHMRWNHFYVRKL